MSVQEPVVPTVVQLGVVRAPGPLKITMLHTVPAGALTSPAPDPSFTFTWQVKVCGVPTSLVAVAGVSWMFAFGTTHGIAVFVVADAGWFVASRLNPEAHAALTGRFDAITSLQLTTYVNALETIPVGGVGAVH